MTQLVREKKPPFFILKEINVYVSKDLLIINTTSNNYHFNNLSSLLEITEHINSTTVISIIQCFLSRSFKCNNPTISSGVTRSTNGLKFFLMRFPLEIDIKSNLSPLLIFIGLNAQYTLPRVLRIDLALGTQPSVRFVLGSTTIASR